MVHTLSNTTETEEMLDSLQTAATKVNAFQATIKELASDFAAGSKLMVLNEKIESQKIQNRELKKRLRETKQSLKEERARREQNEDLTEKLEKIQKMINRKQSYSRSRSRSSTRSRSDGSRSRSRD